jgi:ubiquinone/menaquinone biosynthesis C-methylase UbiE
VGRVRHAVVPTARGFRRGRGEQGDPSAGEPAPAVDRGADQWFWDHYNWAVGELVGFLAEDGYDLTGCDVADVGCGDGIIDLGLAHRVQPRRLVGFDVNPVREDLLLERAASARVAEELPPSLEFAVCEPEKLPADDDAFDAVVTWSAFEHIDDPLLVLTEIRRVLRPDGVLFLQLWPFYNSQHGAHLDEWFPDGFVQFQQDADAIERDVLERAENLDWAQYKLREFRALNRLTLDGLGQALVDAEFRVSKLQLLTERVHLPREVDGVALSGLGISGVMLLAH